MDKTNKVVQMHNSHYCLLPSSEDIRVIERFLVEGDFPDSKDCTLCQQIGRDRVWLKVGDMYVLVPVNSQNWPENMGEVEYASSVLGLRGGAIYFGEVDDSLHEKMTYSSHKEGLMTYWVGDINRVRYSEWMLKLSIDMYLDSHTE